MKDPWLLIFLLFAIGSCKESEPTPPPQTETSSKPSRPKPTPLEPFTDQTSAPKQGDTAISETSASQPKGTANTPRTPALKPTSDQQPHPVAMRVEGLNGYVKSPYNDKIIDVRELPSGTLVQDPTFPPEEKRYFRVP